MWTYMKAEGSAKDADAQHVYVECLRQPEMGLVELITPKVSAKSEFQDNLHSSEARDSCRRAMSAVNEYIHGTRLIHYSQS